jgi:protein ImuB
VRIACLLVPDLPLAAELRAHPELAVAPFAVTNGSEPRAELISVSPLAASQGVRRGITLSHARALCGELVARPLSGALEQATRQALLDAALSFSPRAALTPRGSGTLSAEAAVHLDASGTRSLFRSEAGFAAAISARTKELSLPANVALASSRTVSLLAARRLPPDGEHTCILEPRQERAFLAPLPIDILDPDDALAQTLTRFGVRTVAELLALPRRALTTRLGPRILDWIARLTGERGEPPLPAPENLRLSEAIDLDFPVERLQPLVFVLQGLLSRLLTRLESRHLACSDLGVTLTLSGGARDERRIGVSAPTHDLRVLIRLLQHALEARVPDRPVESIAIETSGLPVRSDQLDLFRPAGPAPSVLDETLTSLTSLCGDSGVGAPVTPDDHHPDALQMQPFRPRSGAARKAPLAPATAHLALRALRPPVSARVRMAGSRPERIESAIARGRVVRAAGPWRITGGWWSPEGRFAFDSYDIQTSDGCIARLRFDHVKRSWQIDALYD